MTKYNSFIRFDGVRVLFDLIYLIKMFAWFLIPLGILMIIYSNKIVEYTGEIDFAEKLFLQGGTYTFIKVFGLGLTILSFMWAMGGLQPLLLSFFGPMFGV